MGFGKNIRGLSGFHRIIYDGLYTLLLNLDKIAYNKFDSTVQSLIIWVTDPTCVEEFLWQTPLNHVFPFSRIYRHRHAYQINSHEILLESVTKIRIK